MRRLRRCGSGGCGSFSYMMRNEPHFPLNNLHRLVQYSRFLLTREQKYLYLMEAGESGRMLSSHHTDEITLIAYPVGHAWKHGRRRSRGSCTSGSRDAAPLISGGQPCAQLPSGWPSFPSPRGMLRASGRITPFRFVSGLILPSLADLCGSADFRSFWGSSSTHASVPIPRALFDRLVEAPACAA